MKSGKLQHITAHTLNWNKHMKNSNYVLDCRASVEPTKDPGKCYAEWLGCKKVPGPVLLAL